MIFLLVKSFQVQVYFMIAVGLIYIIWNHLNQFFKVLNSDILILINIEFILFFCCCDIDAKSQINQFFNIGRHWLPRIEFLRHCFLELVTDHFVVKVIKYLFIYAQSSYFIFLKQTSRTDICKQNKVFSMITWLLLK